MVQTSDDTTRYKELLGCNREMCYILIVDHHSGALHSKALHNKAPPVEWLNNWLAANAPRNIGGKYVCFDQGGELGKCDDVARLFQHYGYDIQFTGTDASHQNGPVVCPHQDIGNAMHAMLAGANLPAEFWPNAFEHHLQLHNSSIHAG